MNQKQKLESLGIRKLISILKSMRNGSVGFDYSKKSKAEIIDVILLDAESYASASEKLQDALGGSPGASVLPDVTPAPYMVLPDAAAIRDHIVKEKEKLKSNGDKSLEEILRERIGGAVDADKVREIVKQETKHLKKPRPNIIITDTKSTVIKKIDTNGKHPVFETVLKLAMARQNVMLVGPAGCGKTYLGKQVAEALQLEFSMLSCTAGTNESQIQGYLLPTGDSGRFEYVISDYATRFQNGGVFLIDEKDALDENLAMIFNAPLGNGLFHVPQNIDQPPFKKHKDFVCIATANTLGDGADLQYTGRNPLDRSTRDRYVFIPMDYDEELEASLVDSDVLLWGHAIRKQIRQHGINQVMSTRMIEYCQIWKQSGFPKPKQWDELYFGSWTKDQRSQLS